VSGRGGKVTFAALALVATAVALLLLAAGLALASSGPDPFAPRFVSTAKSKRAARRDVDRRLATLPLPPSARHVARRSPLTAKRFRGPYPFYGLGYLHVVSGTAFVSFSGGPLGAVRWFLEHPPPGSELYTRTAGPTAADKQYRCLWFELPEDRPLYAARNLTLCAERTRGRTSVRVDAETVWLRGRSRYERVPGRTRYLELVLWRRGERRRSLLADPGRIGRLVDLVNSLPVSQGDNCSVPPGVPSKSSTRVEVVLRASRRGWPIARLSRDLIGENPCTPLEFSLRGRPERGLDEGWLLFRALHAQIARLGTSSRTASRLVKEKSAAGEGVVANGPGRPSGV
jgi:hypothetical protein